MQFALSAILVQFVDKILFWYHQANVQLHCTTENSYLQISKCVILNLGTEKYLT